MRARVRALPTGSASRPDDWPVESNQDLAQFGHVRRAQRQCRWTWGTDRTAHERHQRLVHAIAARAATNLGREFLQRCIKPIQHDLCFGVAARLQQFPYFQLVRRVDIDGPVDVPARAILVCAYWLKRVVDHIEPVRELAHLVILLVVWDVPLDPQDVLSIDEPKHAVSRHRGSTEPLCVVDQHADINRVGDVGEKADDIVLRRMVKEGQVDLHADRPQGLCLVYVIDRVQCVLGLEPTDHRHAAARRRNHCLQQARPFFVGKVRSFANRCSHFEDRLSCDQAVVNPPLRQVRHYAQIERELLVERGRYRGYRSHNQLPKLVARHGSAVSSYLTSAAWSPMLAPTIAWNGPKLSYT